MCYWFFTPESKFSLPLDRRNEKPRPLFRPHACRSGREGGGKINPTDICWTSAERVGLIEVGSFELGGNRASIAVEYKVGSVGRGDDKREQGDRRAEIKRTPFDIREWYTALGSPFRSDSVLRFVVSLFILLPAFPRVFRNVSFFRFFWLLLRTLAAGVPLISSRCDWSITVGCQCCYSNRGIIAPRRARDTASDKAFDSSVSDYQNISHDPWNDAGTFIRLFEALWRYVKNLTSTVFISKLEKLNNTLCDNFSQYFQFIDNKMLKIVLKY